MSYAPQNRLFLHLRLIKRKKLKGNIFGQSEDKYQFSILNF